MPSLNSCNYLGGPQETKNDLIITSLTFNKDFKHYGCRVQKYKLTFPMMTGDYKDQALSRLNDVINDADDNTDL